MFGDPDIQALRWRWRRRRWCGGGVRRQRATNKQRMDHYSQLYLVGVLGIVVNHARSCLRGARGARREFVSVNMPTYDL